MKYCPECTKVFPFDDPFDEQVCPNCDNAILEDIDEYLDRPNIACSACYGQYLGTELQLLEDDEDIYVCPECGAAGTLYLEYDEEE